jgi:hypothetical protein
MGPELIHLATIDLDAAGQAFAFLPGESRRIIAIDRPSATLRQFRLPAIDVTHPDARRFPTRK